MKSYTNIKESKKLAEILQPETADMCWGISDETLKWKTFPYFMPWRDYIAKEHYLPCWSLAALLDILKSRAYSIDEDANVSLSSYKTVEWWDLSICNSVIEPVTKSDLVDACVEMIVKIKEKDLL